MTNSLQRLTKSIENLEELLDRKLSALSEGNLIEEASSISIKIEGLELENYNIKQELDTLKQNYQKLKETSKDVINELNNSIEVIEDYFKKQNANN